MRGTWHRGFLISSIGNYSRTFSVAAGHRHRISRRTPGVCSTDSRCRPSVANDTCQSIRLRLFSPAAEIFGQQFPCIAAGNIPHRKVAVSASARQWHFKLSCLCVPYHAGPCFFVRWPIFGVPSIPRYIMHQRMDHYRLHYLNGRDDSSGMKLCPILATI